MADTVLLVHAVATWLMAGIIWFVQVVHYPLFESIGDAESVAYAERHQRRTSWVVMPPMLIEAATAVSLLFLPEVDRMVAWGGLVILAGIWLSTFALQVPEHNRLRLAADPEAVRRLVVSNWIRTVGWTLRAALATVAMVCC